DVAQVRAEVEREAGEREAEAGGGEAEDRQQGRDEPGHFGPSWRRGAGSVGMSDWAGAEGPVAWGMSFWACPLGPVPGGGLGSALVVARTMPRACSIAEVASLGGGAKRANLTRSHCWRKRTTSTG